MNQRREKKSDDWGQNLNFLSPPPKSHVKQHPIYQALNLQRRKAVNIKQSQIF